MSPQDEEHLRLLSIFHLVLGCITAVFSLFPLIHLFVGLAIIFKAGPFADKNDMDTWFGIFFVVLASVFILVGEALAICMIKASRRLKERRGHMFCQVVAGFECIFFPFGTALGVFTLLVLGRPSVRQGFGVDVPPTTPPTLHT